MNAVVGAKTGEHVLPLHAVTLDGATLQRARAQDAQSGQTVLQELQALTHADPRALVKALADVFDTRALETADMLALTPAFDLLPLVKAMQRHCALLRAPDGADLCCRGIELHVHRGHRHRFAGSDVQCDTPVLTHGFHLALHLGFVIAVRLQRRLGLIERLLVQAAHLRLGHVAIGVLRDIDA
jgi:hypothetical protein